MYMKGGFNKQLSKVGVRPKHGPCGKGRQTRRFELLEKLQSLTCFVKNGLNLYLDQVAVNTFFILQVLETSLPQTQLVSEILTAASFVAQNDACAFTLMLLDQLTFLVIVRCVAVESTFAC